MKPAVKVDNITITYKGKEVRAKRLVVISEIPMHINSIWKNVLSPKLLQFVAQGMIRFKPTGEGFPDQWKEGETYGAKMYIFGFFSFGGTHYLHIEKIDKKVFQIATREWDQGAKVWNHDVILKAIDEGSTRYEDAITIYGGILTGFITWFAKLFYIHRQKRWQIVAKEKYSFQA